MPVLNLDEAALTQVGEMDRMEAVLRLAQRHGRGVVFTVDELGQATVRFHWLGTSSALALLSTPDGVSTLYLNLSGFDPEEDAAAAHYIREITRSPFTENKVCPTGKASALIEFQIAGEGGFDFISKLIHGAYWNICRDIDQRRQSRRGRVRR